MRSTLTAMIRDIGESKNRSHRVGYELSPCGVAGLNRTPNEKWVLLGATSGLAAAFLRTSLLKENAPISLFLTSRSHQKLAQLRQTIPSDILITEVLLDATRTEEGEIWAKIQKFDPTRIFCFIGGGPYGKFAAKKWKDHEWAFQTSFLFPAKIVHEALSGSFGDSLNQVVVIGSSIAESTPDPQAASYSAAKHALKGLITTVQAEVPSVDLRLYSPGYMDTGLLPKDAAPRKIAGRVMNAETVAKDLLQWCFDPLARHTHRTFSSEF